MVEAIRIYAIGALIIVSVWEYVQVLGALQ